MKISPVIQRLRDTAALFGTRVAGAADLGVAQDQESLAVPCAFVVPIEDDAGETTTAGAVTQVIDESIAVIVCVSNTADERGEAAADAIEDVRQQVFAALLGWPPAAGYDGFEYRGGNIVDLNRARMWWRFDFAAISVVQS